MKTKLILGSLLALVPLCFFAQWAGGSGGSSPIYRQGKVGIGTSATASSTDPQLDVLSSNGLGTSPGNNALITRIGSSCGINWLTNSEWLVRNGNNPLNTTWKTVSLHNGISIDGVYNIPFTDTRTWWDRDPFDDIQSWGDQGTPYLVLKQGNLTAYKKVSIGTYYPVSDPNAWYNPKPAPVLDVYSLNTLGGIGDAQLITSFSGPVGTSGASSAIRSNAWLYRKGTGSPYPFSNVVVHDGLSIDASYMTPGIDTKTWWERDAIGDYQAWGNGNATYMSLQQGRLGLNWTGNNARLDINENDNNYSALVAKTDHTVDYTKCIFASVSRDLTKAFSVGDDNYLGTPNNWKETFVVYGNGRTIIGTQTVPSRSGSLLQVSGEIDCQSLYVLKPATWQDKVFDKAYALPSLNEVETYINSNKHLPGIKSEKEILENGYDVNEIDAALLEKIENLYLYIIKQQKEIDMLKNELAEK